MTEKITQEEEHKLISLKSFVDSLQKIQVIDPILLDIQNRLLASLKPTVTYQAIALRRTNELKIVLKTELNDEVNADIYNDEISINMRHYLDRVDDNDFTKEYVIKILTSTLLDIFDKITEFAKMPQEIKVLDGEKIMDGGDREMFKAWANRLVLSYKRYVENGNSRSKNVLASRIYDKADTDEKYQIANNLFYEYTGKHVLDEIKRRETKQETIEVVQNQ